MPEEALTVSDAKTGCNREEMPRVGEMYKDGTYLAKHPSWHTEHSAWKAAQIIKILNMCHLQPRSICEVGCGAGEILNQLYYQLPETTEFYGYEVSPQAFALCQERRKERLNYYLKDLLEDREAFFDLVLAIDVLEHVEDCYGFLRKLRPKGECKVFHIPLDICAWSVLRGTHLLSHRQRVGHIHYFTRETALATLLDTGYEIQKWFYTCGSDAFPDRTLKGMLKRAVRKSLAILSMELSVRVMGGCSLMVLAK